MKININFYLILKVIFSILFLSLSTFFFIQGFIILNQKIFKDDLLQEKIITKDSLNKNKDAIIIKKINQKNQLQEKKENVEKLNEFLIIFKKNDTFIDLISPHIKNSKILNRIVNKVQNEFDLNLIKIGQKILLYKNNKNIIQKIILPIDYYSNIILDIHNDEITINKQKLLVTNELISSQYFISTSFYQDGVEANLPIQILVKAIKLLSFDIDFQRDIKKNNKVEVMYEMLINEKRNDILYGDIKYIKLSFDKAEFEYFLFKTDDDFKGYYNQEGKSVKKALMKTPIDGARLSSNFGMRKHPISGFTKLHKGVDFAAPIGTPVYAAGNGVIEFVGRNGGYGKFIKIRHNNSYKTAYAHLSRYKKNLHKGQRVSQGEVIGYVGSTGKSTGPHLHYEIIFNNKAINPMKMKLPSGKKLKEGELLRFKKESKKIYADHLFNLYE